MGVIFAELMYDPSNIHRRFSLCIYIYIYITHMYSYIYIYIKTFTVVQLYILDHVAPSCLMSQASEAHERGRRLSEMLRYMTPILTGW